MLDKDVTGNIDAAKQLEREKEAYLLNKESGGTGKKNNNDQLPGKDELESDGSGSAFAGTEEVKE